MERRCSPIVLGCVLVILALVSYVPALSGSFVFDDSMYLLDDERVTETSGLGRIWSEVSGPGYRHQYYPLTSSVWWLQWRLWGDNAVGYHVVNVLLHGLCAVLLWRLLVAVKAPGAWLAGLLFCLHPLHVTSVAWISELKNVLSCALMLGSLVVFCGGERTCLSEDRQAWHPESGTDRSSGCVRSALGWTLFVCALMSKTATASLPVALALLVYYRDGRISGRWWGRLGLLSLTGLCAVGLTSYLEWLHRAGGEAFALDLGERIRVASAAVWFYAAKLAFPWGLSFVYPRWDPVSWPWWTWLYPASVVFALGGLWGFRHRISRGPLCAVLFFVVAVAPVSLANVAYTRHSYVADHWAYWGSLGLAALAAGLMVRGYQALTRVRWVVPAGAATAVLMVSVLGAMTWQRATIFESPRTLWSDTVRRNPDASLAHYNLGVALWALGERDKALTHYREAVRLNPDSIASLNNLATALKDCGNFEEAEPIFHEALRLDPDLAAVHVNLGSLYMDIGRLEEAAAHFVQVLRIRPDLALGHYGLANTLRESGRLEAARRRYLRALDEAPSWAACRANLGAVLRAQGDLDGAFTAFNEALRLDPHSAVAHYNVALALRDLGRLDSALEHLQKTAELAPGQVEVERALGELLAVLAREKGRVPFLQE
jgi:tetratricopeptide (TPR) repeat protein